MLCRISVSRKGFQLTQLKYMPLSWKRSLTNAKPIGYYDKLGRDSSIKNATDNDDDSCNIFYIFKDI
jgi:hypothetical protein